MKKIILMTTLGLSLNLLAEQGGVYSVNTSSGTYQYRYPKAPPPEQPNIPEVKVDLNNLECGEQNSGEGFNCNFISKGKGKELKDDYTIHANSLLKDYREELDESLELEPCYDGPSSVFPEYLRPLNDDVIRSEAVVAETLQRILRDEGDYVLKLNRAAKKNILAEDPRLKVPTFNRLLMAENPALNNFAALRIQNGLSFFPHGVELPSSDLHVSSDVMFTAARVGLFFTPAGAPIDFAEATSGYSVLPPFQRLTPGQRALSVVSMAAGSRMFWEGLGRSIGAWRRWFRQIIDPRYVDDLVFDLAADIMGSSSRLVEFGPLKPGVLHRVPEGPMSVGETFRSATYFENDLLKPVKLYRSFSQNRMLGKYWSRVKPTGRTEATIDFAIHRDYNNAMTHYVEIEVPAGVRVYEGVAAPVKFNGMDLLGGGSQVYILDHIPDSWITGPPIPLTP